MEPRQDDEIVWLLIAALAVFLMLVSVFVAHADQLIYLRQQPPAYSVPLPAPDVTINNSVDVHVYQDWAPDWRLYPYWYNIDGWWKVYVPNFSAPRQELRPPR